MNSGHPSRDRGDSFTTGRERKKTFIYVFLQKKMSFYMFRTGKDVFLHKDMSFYIERQDLTVVLP